MRLTNYLLITAFLLIAARLPAQWHQLPALPGGGAHALVQSSVTGNIYAATPNGVYRSLDHTKTWQPAGLQQTEILHLIQFPEQQDEVLFATDDATLFRSVDSGSTWVSVRARKGSAITGVVQDGVNLFVASDSIFKSTDLGRTWTVLAPLPIQRGLNGLVASQGNLFALGLDDHIWTMSTSGGAWTMTKYPSWHYPQSIKVYGREIFVGATGRLDLSTDNGATWLTPNNQGLDTSKDMMSDFAVNGLTIVATTQLGVYRTTDGAGSWTRVDGQNGYYNTTATNVIEFADNSFFSGEPAGVISSPDGLVWHYAGAGMLSSNGISDVASISGDLFACSDKAVFRSSDHGMTWAKPGDLNGVYAFRNLNGAISSGKSIWKSTNPRWRQTSSIGPGVAASIGNVLFGYNGGKDVYKSLDSGTTWETVTRIPTAFFTEALFTLSDTLCCLVSPLADGSQLWFSTDMGDSWSNMQYFPDSGSSVLCHAAIGDLMAIGVYGKLCISTDRGVQWTASSHTAIFAKSVGSNIVLGLTEDASPSNNGLFALDANGILTHILFDTATSPIKGFAVDDSFAYIATQSQGLWTEPRATFPLSVPLLSTLNIGALQVFPNPFSEKTTIAFSLPERAHVSLKLYDELGVMRSIIFDGEREAGAVEIPFEDRTLPNGVYSAVLSAGMTRAVGRVVVER